ncbi:hypothetical protein CLOSYM_03844, partial [[Clostridium] symbiosum ATCC 14940]
SRLARALWIEIKQINQKNHVIVVEARESLVDRNETLNSNNNQGQCRGSREPCGSKSTVRASKISYSMSRLARALWIE